MSEAARLESVIHQAAEAIIIFDERGLVETFNLAAQRLFGYNAGDSDPDMEGLDGSGIIGGPVERLLPPETGAAQTQDWTAAVGLHRERQGRHRDGRPLPLQLSLSEALVGQQRVFTAFIRQSTSSSDEQLERISQYLDALLMNLPAGVAILEGPDFCYFKINQTLADLNGLTIERHLGRRLVEVLPHAETMLVPELQRVLRTGVPIIQREFSITLPANPGKQVNLIDWQIPVRHRDSERAAVVSIVVDRTQLTEAQSMLIQSNKLASLGEMTAGLAHEINQPLGVIQGRMEITRQLLADGQPLDLLKLGDNLDKIEAEIDRATKIIRHLRLFSRQDLLGELEEIDVGWLIDQSLVLQADTLRVEGIAIERQLAAELPKIRCDYIQLEQVLTNLIANARDALLGSDEKIITIKAYRQAASLCIEVQDTGMGISEAYIDKVFDPFFTTKPVGEGTGLGLSISYGIVHEAGGRLTLQSQPAQGSTFTITLPIRD